LHSAEPPSPSPASFPPGASALAESYARLEDDLRGAIDGVTARVCPDCDAPCCRAHYCRETARNPWYRLVNWTGCHFPVPADWGARRDPFGLGPRGCAIRSGRYVFCYSFNCRRVLAALEETSREEFQELSDLLLAVNRLPRGRFLHEVRRSEELTAEDLQAMDRALVAVRLRLSRLRPKLHLADRTSPPQPPQADGRCTR